MLNSARWWGVLIAVVLLWGASAWWLNTSNKKLAAETAERAALVHRYKQLRARYSPSAQKVARKRLVEYIRRRGAEVKTRHEGGVWRLEALVRPDVAEGFLKRLFMEGPVLKKVEISQKKGSVWIVLEVHP